MKALIYEGEKKLRIEERPVPVPKEGEVLIKVKACGICGSDVHGYLGITGRRLPGYAMGHEFSGQVASLGAGVSKVKTGQSVVIQPISSCGSCVFCVEGNNNLCPDRKLLGVMDVQGAMAEYICVSEEQLIPMGEGCSFEIGALTEPFAVAYSAVEKVRSYEGKTVLIIGAGMIGLCILEMVKTKNPAKIIVSDLSDIRLERAGKRGADVLVNPQKGDFEAQISKGTGSHMCDIVFEAVGREATANQSIEALKKNGTAIWVGVSQHEITIDMHQVVTYQRTITGSMNYTQKEFEKTAELLASGKLYTDGLITKKISLDQASEYFDELHDNPDEYLKVIIVF